MIEGMFTHAQIWRAIDALAELHHCTPSGLAKKAGLDPTTFNKSKRIGPSGKLRWPSTESLSKILSATGSSFIDFVELLAEPAKSEYRHFQSPSFIGLAENDDEPLTASLLKNRLSVPTLFSRTDNTSCFVIEVTDKDRTPLYAKGSRLILSPLEQISPSDRVVIETNTRERLFRIFVKRTSKYIVVKKQASNAEDTPIERVALDHISWMARIMWVSQ